MSLGCVDRQVAVEPADRGATAARLALVAGLCGVVEIGAARALEQVARGRCLVAKLSAGAGHQRAAEHAVILADTRVGGEIGVADECPDAEAAVGGRRDLVETQAVDVDQMLRRLDLQLHQVEQIGAARDELGARHAGRGARGLLGRGGALIGEGLHAVRSVPATSWIASMMLA
jgi:hypothetical protein